MATHLAHLHPKANIWAKFHENRSKTEEVVHDARFFAIICCYHGNTLSATLKKMCLAHLHPKAKICTKFHENWRKTEEVVRDARFSPHFCHMPLPWQHTFCHCQKNVSCTSTPQGKHLYQISWELVKNWGSSSRRKIFSPIICRYHGNTLSATVKKMCLAHLHPKANICAKFHARWTLFLPLSKNVVKHLCHWGSHSYHGNASHGQKNVSCTSTPQGKHVWELVKNWGSSSRRKIFSRLPWQHTFCHCQKNVSCTSTPQGKHLCQISWELVKNWGSSSRRKIFPPFLP